MTIHDTWNHISSIETVQSLVMTIDKKGCITRINSAGCEILQVREEQITGESWVECFVDEDDSALTAQVFNKLFTSEEETIINLVYHTLTAGAILPSGNLSGKNITLTWYQLT